MSKSENYQNSPLVETVFEIKFQGKPAVECNRDKFFEKIREKYPVVLVPSFNNIANLQSISFAPYQFESEDKLSGIKISINSFAFFL